MLSANSVFQRHALKPFQGNYQEFKNLIKNARDLVVINFTADWSLPCQTLAHDLKEVSNSFPKMTFIKSDVEECEEIGNHFNIEVVPQVKVFRRTATELHEIKTYIGHDSIKVKELLQTITE